MKIRADLAGVADLQARFRELDAEIQGPAMDRALYQGGLTVLKLMRDYVPYDSSDRDGDHLRDHLHVERRKRSKNQKVVVGPDRKWQHIAAFVEFGTAPHFINPRGLSRTKTGRRRKGAKALAGGGFGPYRYVRHPGAAADPFMRPAFKQGHTKALRVMRNVLAHRIEDLTR